MEMQLYFEYYLRSKLTIVGVVSPSPVETHIMTHIIIHLYIFIYIKSNQGIEIYLW